MVGHIDDSWLIGCCGVVNDKAIVLTKRINNGEVHFAWIPIFTIFYLDRKTDGVVHLPCLPNLLVNAIDTPMQGVDAIVLWRCKHLPINAEFSIGDAVGIAANNTTKIGFTRKKILRAVVSQ